MSRPLEEIAVDLHSELMNLAEYRSWLDTDYGSEEMELNQLEKIVRWVLDKNFEKLISMNYQTWKQLKVAQDPQVQGGQPCFVGTRVPIYRVAAYTQGWETYRTMFEEFPFLTTQDIRYAVQYINEGRGDEDQ